MGNMCKVINVEDREIDLQSETDYSKNEFQEIKEFRKEILNMNVFERKNIAIKEYQNFIKSKNYNDNNENISNEKILKYNYIKIKCLVLIDNTNKDIIKLYLDFIKQYSKFIEKNELTPYEKEINKYKILFTVDEMKLIEPNIKTISQKSSFLDYLENICQINSKNDFNEIKSIENAKKELKKLFLFNTPIEFDNKELYFYKCLYNFIFEISIQMEDEIIDFYEAKKIFIEFLKKNNTYNNSLIISNEDKMNLLLLYLLHEEEDDERKLINVNRLIQKIPITKEDFYKFNKENKDNNLVLYNDKLYIAHKYDISIDDPVLIPLENACLKNLNNPNIMHESSDKYYFNLDTLLVRNKITPYINDIKKFLIRIIDTNVFQQALQEIFPDYYKILVYNNNKDLKQYINERIKFYPFQNLKISGITDKLSCYSYIPSINFQVSQKDIKIQKINEDTYKVGLTIVNSLHEEYHAIRVIIFFKGNNKNILFSPKRIIGKNNRGIDIELCEGGFHIEYLLFGRAVSTLDLFECLYIMNEDNYKQDINDFRENFKNIRKIVLDSKGNTDLIKIKNGIFKKFYDNSIEEIKSIIKELKKKASGFVPRIFVGKYNFDSEDEEDYIPKKKCGLMGPRNRVIFHINK